MRRSLKDGGGYHIVVSKVVIEPRAGVANLALGIRVVWTEDFKPNGREDICPGGMLYAPSSDDG